LTYPLAMVPMTMLGKRFGPRKFIPVSLLLIAAFSMLQTIMPNFGSFVTMRALLGVAEAGMFPMFKYTLSMFYGKVRFIDCDADIDVEIRKYTRVEHTTIADAVTWCPALSHKNTP